MATDKDIKIISEKVCVSSKALREIFNVDESTIVRWGQKQCPKIQRGWWAVEDVLKWKSSILTSANIQTEDDIEKLALSDKKTYMESQLKEAQVEALKFKNAIACGDYIPKQDIVKELSRTFTILKRSIQSLANKIAMELSPFVGQTESRRMSKLVKDITNDALRQMCIDGAYDTKGTNKK